MLKRIELLLLMLTISIMISSCSLSSYTTWKDMTDAYPNQKGKVQVISDDGSNYHIEYEGNHYNIDKLKLFRVKENTQEIPEDDVLVGWDALPFGIGYLDKYYSYTSDSPVFIYISRYNELYLRNDYNYEADIFVIKGTDQRFVFSDMFTLSNAFSYDSITHYADEIDIILYSDMYPRLQIPLRLFCVNNVWFAGGNSNFALFEVSDELLDLLNIDTCIKIE